MSSDCGKARVLVVGSGGVGTMVSYALESGGLAEVTSVLRSNFTAVQSSGFQIDSLDHGNNIQKWRPTQIRNTMPNVIKEGLRPFEYVVVTTKDIPDVPPLMCDILETAITPGISTIVLIQNGINIEKPMISKYPTNVVLSGVQMIGATEITPGTILHNEPDRSKLGYFYNPNISDQQAEACARKFVKLYSACNKVDCTYDDNVTYTRWHKLLYNSSYNAVAAILKMDVTRMRAYESIIDELVKPAMHEIQAIAAAAAGVKLADEITDYYLTVDSPQSWFMPSMGQDSVKGQFMEFENIVGEPLRMARSAGVPSPVLSTLYSILKGMQLKTKETRGLIEPSLTEVSKYYHSRPLPK